MASAKYSVVLDSEEQFINDALAADRKRLLGWQRIARVALILSALLAALTGSFFLGQSSAKAPTSHAIKFDIIPHTFRYNRSFSEIPSASTNHAWRELFPKEGGFFINADIAPKRSTFHVFHTLHCLNHMRQAYWLNHQAAIAGRQLLDKDVFVDFQPSHVRHCIDLIRQSLMCQGDTTLEVVDESINGVHGFRTEHQCVDWDQLRDWTSRQQVRQHVEQIE